MCARVRAGSTAASWATTAWAKASPGVSDGKNATPSAGTSSTCSAVRTRAGSATSVSTNTRAPRACACSVASTVLW